LAVVEHASRVTHESLFSEWPTWSPDGRMFAFSSNRAGDYEIYVRRVEGGQEINVTNHPSDDVQPAFSPDGNTIAFVSTRSSATGLVKIGTFVGFNTRTFGGDVWIAPALGGSARRIAEDGNFPVWEPSGRALLYVTGIENQRQIVRAPIDGGPAMKVLPAEASRWEIIRLGASQNGRWITFETSDREVFAVPSSGSGSPKLLLEGTSHAWDGSSRRLFYVVQEADASTRIEAADLADDGTGLRTTRVTVADVSVGMLKDLAVSADGRRVLAVSNEESVNLTRAPLSAAGDAVTGPEEELSDGTVRDRYPVVSPDGRRIAVGSNRTGEDQLWVVDVAARRWDAVHMPEREAGWVTQACWARDSLHLIAMRYASDGTSAFWSVALDGSSAKQILPPRRALAGSFACDVSPDTRHMVYTRVANGFNQLFVLDLATGEDRQFTTSPSHKYAAAWSPDGRWVAYSANTGGTVHVWRMRADGGSAEEQLTTGRERNTHLFYSPDGRWIYINPSHHNIARLPAAGGPPQPVTHFPEKGLFIEEPTISADGQWLVYGRGKGGASVWLLTIGTR
jgi:Tol biopolymer transport system component